MSSASGTPVAAGRAARRPRRRRRGTCRRRRRPRAGCRWRARPPRRRAAAARARPPGLGRHRSAEGGALQQADRCGAVGQADDQVAHRHTSAAIGAGTRSRRRRRRRPRPGRGRQRARAALLVEGEDLQLGGEVDLADVDVLGHASTQGAKLRTLRDPGGDQPVADLLGGARRRRDHADVHVGLPDDLLETRLTGEPPAGDPLADPPLVVVQERVTRCDAACGGVVGIVHGESVTSGASCPTTRGRHLRAEDLSQRHDGMHDDCAVRRQRVHAKSLRLGGAVPDDPGHLPSSPARRTATSATESPRPLPICNA